MPSSRRQKPAQAPSVDGQHNDSAHVPRAYGEDELPLSDVPDSVEDEVAEVPVPVVEDPGPAPGPAVERPEWSTAGVLNDPNVRAVTPSFPFAY